MSQSGLEGMKPSHRPGTEHGGKRRETDGRRDCHAAIAGFDQFGDQPISAVFVDVLLLVLTGDTRLTPHSIWAKATGSWASSRRKVVGGKQPARLREQPGGVSHGKMLYQLDHSYGVEALPGLDEARDRPRRKAMQVVAIEPVGVLDLRGTEVGAQTVDAVQVIADESSRPAADVDKPGPGQMGGDGANFRSCQQYRTPAFR